MEVRTANLIRQEVQRARGLFPHNTHLLAALVEEVGEVAKALLEYGNGKRAQEEAVQVAAMAIRLIEEGCSDFGKEGNPNV